MSCDARTAGNITYQWTCQLVWRIPISGAVVGDVTTTKATVWSRADQNSTMQVSSVE